MYSALVSNNLSEYDVSMTPSYRQTPVTQLQLCYRSLKAYSKSLCLFSSKSF